MKKHYTFYLLFLLSYAAQAQQEQMYTQFFFNKLAFNPAYAGGFSSPELTVVYRKQWIGLDGAPDAQALTFHQQGLGRRIGVGGGIQRQSIGIITKLTIDLSFAYRMEMRRGTLSVGFQPSMRSFRQNWADERIRAIQKNDNSIPTETQSKLFADFAFGGYYAPYKNHWYAGASIQRLFGSSIDFSLIGTEVSREVQHVNVMGGMTFSPNKEIKITPQALFKYAVGAPFDAELNVSALLKKKFYSGLTYRAGGDTKKLGESVDVMLGMQATDKLFFSLSYDIGLTRLRKYGQGSIEAVARWWFNPPPDEDIFVDPSRPF